MAARATAFAEPAVIRLASESFIPLAEDCTPLQTQRDAKGEFFRLVAEQGQYAFTADGTLLASVNTSDAETMLEMMHRAFARWELFAAVEDGQGVTAATYERDPRHPDLYPVGGLVLKQTMRDLPRPEGHASPQQRPEAINFDYAWFTADEVRDFLPDTVRVGVSKALPRRIVRRLARFHLLDSVRGETPPWRDEDVQDAAMTTEVVAVDGDRVHLRLDGGVLNSQDGTWATTPFQEKLEGMARGYHCRLRGELTFDTRRGRLSDSTWWQSMSAGVAPSTTTAKTIARPLPWGSCSGLRGEPRRPHPAARQPGGLLRHPRRPTPRVTARNLGGACPKRRRVPVCENIPTWRLARYDSRAQVHWPIPVSPACRGGFSAVARTRDTLHATRRQVWCKSPDTGMVRTFPPVGRRHLDRVARDAREDPAPRSQREDAACADGTWLRAEASPRCASLSARRGRPASGTPAVARAGIDRGPPQCLGVGRGRTSRPVQPVARAAEPDTAAPSRAVSSPPG